MVKSDILQEDNVLFSQASSTSRCLCTVASGQAPEMELESLLIVAPLFSCCQQVSQMLQMHIEEPTEV